MARPDGRSPGQIRPIDIDRGFTDAAPGSVLWRSGRTIVFVTAQIEDRVPPWMAGRGSGWLTAEYAMLPGSTRDRKSRAASTGRVDGRTHEIQRLVGRSLRSVFDLKAIGERTIWLDCDVLQADGGTRTAAINAAYVALCDALRNHGWKKPLPRWPIQEPLAAISVGIVGDEVVCDLDYQEDHRAAVDMNVVMTASGRYLEVQGTGEGRAFSADELTALLAAARSGVEQVLERTAAAFAER